MSKTTKSAARVPALNYLTEARVPLPGSDRTPMAPTGKRRAAVQPKVAAGARKRISVSVIVHCAKPIPASAVAGKHLTRAQFKAAHGAAPAAVKAVTAFAKAYGLTPKSDPARRTIQLTGTVADMQKAFGIALHQHTDGETTFRIREGQITLPQSLLQHVQAVLGLDDRPQASPHFRVARPRAVSSSFTPPQLAKLYSFPAGASAAGQTIALIELGGGYRTADITAYFKSIGVAAPKVVAVPVDGGKNSPSTADGADGEVMLDIEVAAAVAPGANIAVYFAPNTDQGFVDAITTATHDTTNKPTVISVSWGGPESSWTAQARNALDTACKAAAALGITVTVAAGDNGSADGVSDGANHVDFPASSPNVLACGGTKLVAANNAITSEVVWNETANNEGATGGGISTAFPQPAWQAGIAATRKGRGVPDVSGDADPTTGYQIRVDGQTMVIGGTSAVAPLWAGLIAVCNARNKSAAGLIQPKIYAAKGAKAFRDITQGNNGAYKAGAGWDACTGLGSPIGTAIAALLASGANKKSAKKSAKTGR
ncbi:S53 family peptidase [Terriglobus roseus]|uniref:Kumamolisin. Serine peptidase. MEROPS family S53 n=1 Tax=Terriglobus roseus TaxID=392734 RepID=A0A1H4T9L0_9BACT|nr:S53 family peptidase [Terriglobus roseus]SEC53112.1 kumamolisin. Serine peptidase. MEROPS family S53 [Terriglobus roseus]